MKFINESVCAGVAYFHASFSLVVKKIDSRLNPVSSTRTASYTGIIKMSLLGTRILSNLSKTLNYILQRHNTGAFGVVFTV